MTNSSQIKIPVQCVTLPRMTCTRDTCVQSFINFGPFEGKTIYIRSKADEAEHSAPFHGPAEKKNAS